MTKIAVIGDVMLDTYHYCKNRDNPESSAPCYIVERTEYKPGGAGNVAANLASLGSDSKLVSVIGNDPHSLILKEVLDKANIDHDLVLDNERQTIVKARYLSSIDGRYHYRADFEKKQYINSNHVSEIMNKLNDYEIIIVSDYNKGMISEKLMEELKKVNKKVIIDPKPNHKNFYKNTFLITPNVKEIREMSGLEDELKAAEKIMGELNSNVLLTRSEKGVSYFGLDGKRINYPTEAKKVFDVTGAGDTVIATLTHFYNKGFDLQNSIKLANKAAGIAVAYPGCYQVTEKEILDNLVT